MDNDSDTCTVPNGPLSDGGNAAHERQVEPLDNGARTTFEEGGARSEGPADDDASGWHDRGRDECRRPLAGQVLALTAAHIGQRPMCTRHRDERRNQDEKRQRNKSPGAIVRASRSAAQRERRGISAWRASVIAAQHEAPATAGSVATWAV